MKLYTIAIGAGLGYLAGNESARRKVMDTARRVQQSPQAQAVEQRLTSKFKRVADEKLGTGGQNGDQYGDRYGDKYLDEYGTEVSAPLVAAEPGESADRTLSLADLEAADPNSTTASGRLTS